MFKKGKKLDSNLLKYNPMYHYQYFTIISNKNVIIFISFSLLMKYLIYNFNNNFDYDLLLLFQQTQTHRDRTSILIK